MNQAELRKLIPSLKFVINHRHRNLKNPGGDEVRLRKIGKTVTQLFKEERIELNYPRADEARGYAERLISEAIRYGDCHKPTMELVDFYIDDKQVIHKLFKVLAPRFKEYKVAYTNLYKAPINYSVDCNAKRALLELKGHPFPPIKPWKVPTHNWINNVLLDEAKKEFNRSKEKREGSEEITM